MNFILFSDIEDIWRESINDSLKPPFKEVDVYGRERVDAVFGEISPGLLRGRSSDSKRGLDFLEIQELFGSGGIRFALFELETKNLLYEDEKYYEELLGFFSENDYRFEIRSTCLQAVDIMSTAFKTFILIYTNNIKIPIVLNEPNGMTFEKYKSEGEDSNVTPEMINFYLKQINNNILV